MPRRVAGLCRCARTACSAGDAGVDWSERRHHTPSAAGAATPTASLPGVADAITVADLWIREQIAYHGVPGVAIAVVHDGEIVWTAGYGSSNLATGASVTPQTRFRLGSVSKLFTATAVLILRDEGRLRLEDPVNKYLPWFAVKNPFGGRPSVTVEQLLTHTSGSAAGGAIPVLDDARFSGSEGTARLRSPRSRSSPVQERSTATRTSESPSWGDRRRGLRRELVGVRRAPDSLAARHDPQVWPSSPADFPSLARAYLRKRPDGSRGTASPLPDSCHRASELRGVDGRGPGALRSLPSRPTSAARELDATDLDARRRRQHRRSFSTAATPRNATRPIRLPRMGRRTRPGFRSGAPGRPNLSVPRRMDRRPSRDLILDPSRSVAVVALTNADDASPALFSRKVLDIVGGAIERATTKAPARGARIRLAALHRRRTLIPGSGSTRC